MLARLCRRTAQISTVALGIAWAAAAGAEPGLSGNSSSRSGAHNVPNPAPRYTPSAPPANSNNASLAPGRSYASGPDRSATVGAGPNNAPGPGARNTIAPPGGQTASSIAAIAPNPVTSLSANSSASPGALSTAATPTSGFNTSTFPLADRNTANSPISVALGLPEGQMLPAPKAPPPQQAIITSLIGALQPTAVALLRGEEPCDGLRLTPDCRPQGTFPYLLLGVPQPRWGSVLSGNDERMPLEPTDW